MSGSELGQEDIAVKKKHKNPCLHRAYILMESGVGTEMIKNKKVKINTMPRVTWAIEKKEEKEGDRGQAIGEGVEHATLHSQGKASLLWCYSSEYPM